MQSQPPVKQLDALKTRVNSWTEGGDPLVELAQNVDIGDLSLEEMIGTQTIKSDDVLSLPLLFEYSRSTKRTSYRRGQAITDDSDSHQGNWVEVDPRLSLKRAFEIYGQENVLAYEKRVERTSLEILVVSFRKKHEQSLRVLVRQPR